MTEDALELAQVHAQLEHMSRKKMPQRMNGDTKPDPAVGHGRAHRRLNPTGMHRREGLAHAHHIAGGVREQQTRVLVGLPPLAQHAQQRLGDRHVPILVTLAVADMDAHALPVDIADLQSEPLAQPQAGTVERDEEHPVAQLVDRAQQTQGLLARQHVRKPADMRRFDDIDPVPWSVQDMTIEELQTAALELDCAPRVGFEQIGEVLAHLLGAQIVRTAVEIRRRAPYGTGVSVLRGLGLSLQLQGALHALVQGGKAGLFYGIHEANLQAVAARFATPPDIGGLGDYAEAASSAAIAAPSNKANALGQFKAPLLVPRRSALNCR